MTGAEDLRQLLFIPWPTASFSSASEDAGGQDSPSPAPQSLGQWEEKDSFEIPIQGKVKVFMLCHEDTLSCYLKINTLNLKNADPCVSRVRQCSTLKDYYYFYTRLSLQIASQTRVSPAQQDNSSSRYKSHFILIKYMIFEQLLYLLFVRN